MEFPIFNDYDNNSISYDHLNSNLIRKLISIRKIITSCFSCLFLFFFFLLRRFPSSHLPFDWNHIIQIYGKVIQKNGNANATKLEKERARAETAKKIDI